MMEMLLKLAGWNLVQDFFGWGEAAQLKDWGVLAEFESPAGVYQACEKVRDAGFQKWTPTRPSRSTDSRRRWASRAHVSPGSRWPLA